MFAFGVFSSPAYALLSSNMFNDAKGEPSGLAGFHMAIWTSDWPLPAFLFFEWVLFQVVVSLMLLIQVGHSFCPKKKKSSGWAISW